MNRTFVLAWVDPIVSRLQAELLQAAIAQEGVPRVIIFPFNNPEAYFSGAGVVHGMVPHLIISEFYLGSGFDYIRLRAITDQLLKAPGLKFVVHSAEVSEGAIYDEYVLKNELGFNYVQLARAIVPLLKKVHELLGRS